MSYRLVREETAPPARPPAPWARVSASALRATDDDRDAAAKRIRDAFERGALSVEELEDREGRALSALLCHDLDALVVDLPVPSGLPTVVTSVQKGRRSLVLPSVDWERVMAVLSYLVIPVALAGLVGLAFALEKMFAGAGATHHATAISVRHVPPRHAVPLPVDPMSAISHALSEMAGVCLVGICLCTSWILASVGRYAYSAIAVVGAILMVVRIVTAGI